MTPAYRRTRTAVRAAFYTALAAGLYLLPGAAACAALGGNCQ